MWDSFKMLATLAEDRPGLPAADDRFAPPLSARHPSDEEEIRRTIELKRHFVIVPAFRSNCRRVDYSYPHMLDQPPEQPYNSSTAAPMSREELRQYLRDNRFLDP